MFNTSEKPHYWQFAAGKYAPRESDADSGLPYDNREQAEQCNQPSNREFHRPTADCSSFNNPWIDPCRGPGLIGSRHREETRRAVGIGAQEESRPASL